MSKTYLYVDTEFNGFAGQLISIAVVEPISLKEFYEVAPLPNLEFIHPWVRQHVVPVLEKESIPLEDLRKKLWEFVGQFTNPVFVADWPEDLGHAAMLMCTSEGRRPPIQFECKMIKSHHWQKTNPHNALADAWDLGLWAHSNMYKWI